MWFESYHDELTEKEDFEIEVHSLILYHEWYNTFSNGFRVYKAPVKFDDDD